MRFLKPKHLSHKVLGYTMFFYATGLLNAGMHIEVLRDLLGHHSLEQTRRYANLTDKTRKAEYFRTMAIIEGSKNK